MLFDTFNNFKAQCEDLYHKLYEEAKDSRTKPFVNGIRRIARFPERCNLKLTEYERYELGIRSRLETMQFQPITQQEIDAVLCIVKMKNYLNNGSIA